MQLIAFGSLQGCQHVFSVGRGKKRRSKGIFGKIFEGEMLIRTLPSTLLQIFCKIILNFKDFIKSIMDPGVNF